MAYRLSAEGPVSKEISRVAAEEFRAATGHLSSRSRKNQPKAIHEARKSVKKLRALLRLLSPHLNKEFYRKTNHGLRDVGRTVSHLRDAQAMREALDALLKSETAVNPETAKMVRERLQTAARRIEERAHPNTALPAAITALRGIQQEWEALEWPELDRKLLEVGLKRTYKRGRRALGHAEREGDAVSFHDWRKRVKDHWYHARLLSEYGNDGWQSRAADLKTLEGLLGDDHNLSMIGEAVGRRDQNVRDFQRLLKERSGKLRDEAAELGEKLYGKKWSTIAEQLSGPDKAKPRKPAARAERDKTAAAIA